MVRDIVSRQGTAAAPNALPASLDSPSPDQSLFQQAVEESTSLVVIADAVGVVQYVNPEFSRVTGYSAEEITGRRIHEFGDLPAQQRGELWETVSNGRQWRGEFRAVKKSGEEFWVLSSVSPMKSSDGTIIHFLSVNLDITERRRMEEALRQGEESYRSVVEISPDAITVTDLNMKVILCNQQAASLHGYDGVQDMIGRTVLGSIVPEDRERAVENARKTLDLGSVKNIEYTLIKRDGTRFPVELSASVITDAAGNPSAFVAVVRDISQRKQAEEALRHSEERYRALYQDNPTMYFTVDTKGTVLSVNQFGAEQLGYSVEELVGRPVLDVFYEEDKKSVVEQLEKCLASGGRVAHWEFRKVRKDGEIIWVKEAARATRDIDGKVIVLVVCEDITEHKRMEEALQVAREELENRVERQLQSGSAYGLSFRELTILHLVVDGKADKEIGTALGISSQTVNKHVANIRRKMGASSRTAAGVRALKEGLVT